jgi:hypothetical protein
MAAAMESDPKAKLGTLFWIVWWAVFVLAASGYVFGIFYAVTHDLWSPVWGTIAVVAFMLVMWAIAFAPYLLKSRMKGAVKMRPAMRRYLMRFMPAMFIYGLILIPGTSYFVAAKPTGLLAWAIAIAPAIPVLFAIRAVMLYHKEEDDEFIRAMAAQSQLMGMGLTMAVCTVYGFLDLYRLAPHVEAWAVFPLWAVCTAPAQFFTWRRYR